MRGSPGALRISLLVCAGVASGYLWRAALEAPPGAISEALAPGLPLARPVPAQVVTPRAVHHAKAKTHARKAAGQASRVRQRRHAALARARLASAGGAGHGSGGGSSS